MTIGILRHLGICVVLLFGFSCNSGLSVGEADLPADPAQGAHDSDGDGIRDLAELRLGTDPFSIDSDGDGLTDHYETWGISGLAVGVQGSLTGLPDPNANGLYPALDPAEAGLAVLDSKQLSSVGTQRMAIPTYNADAAPTPTDPDGDLIPSDYELSGYYVEYESASGQLYFVKWDGEDYAKNYYKTDPLKWSTDADPWSDYEESTKINLDQRIKSPGDHPLVPAYPDVQVVLKEFTWEQDQNITDGSGKKATASFTAGIKYNWKSSTKVSAKVKAQASALNWGEAEYGVEQTMETGGEISASGTVGGELSWTSTTASNTIKTAKLTLNAAIINVGTLPATNPKITCVLKLGGFAIRTFVVSLNGDLPALSPVPVDVAITADGQTPPQDIYLSLNQLKGLMMGAPLTVSVIGFQADTIVSELDSKTGRRINLNVGPWSPYAAAIQNNTARLVIDLNTSSEPDIAPNGLPKRRIADSRVFAFAPGGSYFGSPPVITLRDGLRWICNARNALGDTFVTVYDAVSGQPYTASLRDWSVTLYPDDFALVNGSAELQADLLKLPLKPSNPQERAYFANAPAIPGEFTTQVNWATVFAFERTLLATISNDRSAISAVLIPRPGAGGIPLSNPAVGPGSDTEDEQLSLFRLALPEGYLWSGYERLEVTDAEGTISSFPVELWRNQLLTSQFDSSSALQPGVQLDLDKVADAESQIDDLLVSRPAGPYVSLRIEALNGARITDVLSVYGPSVDYTRLRKGDFLLETLDLDTGQSPDFYEGQYVVGMLTSSGRFVKLVFYDVADAASAGTTVRFNYSTYNGI